MMHQQYYWEEKNSKDAMLLSIHTVRQQLLCLTDS